MTPVFDDDMIPDMTSTLEKDLELFSVFVRDRTSNGSPLESLEESLAEFRAWQSELVRFQTGLNKSLQQASNGETRVLDAEAMKRRLMGCAASTLVGE